MRAFVTGAAGFIGSTLVDRLLGDGHHVRGVDCFTPYYDPAAKRANLVGAIENPAFEFVEADLRVRDPQPLIADVDVVFHLAAQPGVRLSWAEGFRLYDEHNILVTQRLLEAAKATPGLRRVVYASSSSIYGNAPTYPTNETDMPSPHSPYGVTKLAGENLCGLYAANWNVPAVSLRYFTVYGPRQRPDMAIHRLIEAGLTGERFSLFGTGEQVRDFTFVGDVVLANIAAGEADLVPGTVLNVAGGSQTKVNDLVTLAAETLGSEIPVTRMLGQPGDVERTGGATDLARTLLDWSPQVSLAEGLAAQVEWHLARHKETGRAAR